MRSGRTLSLLSNPFKYLAQTHINVFGHRTMKISHPVRSAVNKHRIDRLVLQWVTMWESRLLNSFSCSQLASSYGFLLDSSTLIKCWGVWVFKRCFDCAK